MNKVVLMGRLTRDPNVTRNNDIALARFTIAVDRQFARRDEQGNAQADFISCKAWRKTAETIEKYVHKGTKILLEGRIETGSYQKDGQTVYTTDVVVDSFEFCEKAGADASGTEYPSSSSSSNYNDNSGFMNIPSSTDDDLPFN
ncbi:MAG: single-stranded DNA-binding protein [Lachnospiraceae bacterium]|nr:single-stranded DNA-binding protein [Lachnospiraceae bacterium]